MLSSINTGFFHIKAIILIFLAIYFYRVSSFFWSVEVLCNSIKRFRVRVRKLCLEWSIRILFLLPSKRMSQVNPFIAQLSLLLSPVFIFIQKARFHPPPQTILHLVKTGATFEKIGSEPSVRRRNESLPELMIIAKCCISLALFDHIWIFSSVYFEM